MPPPRSATIAQAKRSYKDRGRPQLTELEQRQIARASELDRRAWKVREQEKRKVEATKKRKEKEEKLKGLGPRAQIGSQRRHDRFGFASSQAHLGKWFGGGGGGGNSSVSKIPKNIAKNETGPEEAEGLYDEIDDDDLLQAINCTDEAQKTPANAKSMPPPPIPCRWVENPPHAGNRQTVPRKDPRGLEMLASEIESSTQITYELEQQTALIQPQPIMANTSFNSNTSFGSSDFDLSAEDIEALDPSIQSKQEAASQGMPPPQFISWHRTPQPQQIQDAVGQKQGQITSTACKRFSTVPFIRSSKCINSSPRIDFTSSQLERFIDDDIQLTQLCPG